MDGGALAARHDVAPERGAAGAELVGAAADGAGRDADGGERAWWGVGAVGGVPRQSGAEEHKGLAYVVIFQLAERVS